MTIVEADRAVTGGVDTHLDLNVAAALDSIGGLLGVKEFSTTRVGHGELLGWLVGFGTVTRVGIEGTGSHGAGLARFLRGSGVEVLEVDQLAPPPRRRLQGGDGAVLGHRAQRQLRRKPPPPPPS